MVPPEYILQEQASGADTNRPLLAEIRQLVRHRKINVIIIYRLDRLSRDTTDLFMLWEEITEQGVEIRLLQGPDGNSLEDKLLRSIDGYRSESERRDILERTMRASICTTDTHDRAVHSYGRSFRDRIRAFNLQFPNPPDVIAYPRDEQEGQSLISATVVLRSWKEVSSVTTSVGSISDRTG